MAKEVRLPRLGQTMQEGTVVSCRVNVGDKVTKGDILFEMETDKATLEMESPASGFVKYILVKVDETLPVGDALMVLGDQNEDVPQSFVDALKGEASAGSATSVAPIEQGQLKSESAMSTGIITEEDVQNAAGQKGTAAKRSAAVEAQYKGGQIIPLNRLQKITAEKMLQSKREIPCFYLTVKADVTELVKFRTEMNLSGEVKISYNDIIMKAVATGLTKYPIMTGQLYGDTIRLAQTINIGLAISVEDGLVAPIAKDVDKKDVRQIARDTKAIIERARNGKLSPTDLEGGCITVSNLGAFGIDNFIPIVVPGQCSILGVGQISQTYTPGNGDVVLRMLMNMTLSVDHKVANGAYAAQFLDFVRKQLEDTSNFAC